MALAFRRPMLLQRRPVDGAGLEARRRAGLQPPHRETRAVQAIREPDRRRLAVTAGGDAPVADMDDALQECARGQHHARRDEEPAVGGGHAGDSAVLNDQVLDGGRADLEALLRRSAACMAWR